ncbi:hypothetical protein B0H21DRAFT_748594 [Amylocystis lapponica]|nr:hypothetical protein B0H21DRAFT_748594 [Amylocystis lapponica]
MSRSFTLDGSVATDIAPEISANTRLPYTPDGVRAPLDSPLTFDTSCGGVRRAPSSSSSPLKRKRSKTTIEPSTPQAMASTSSPSPSRKHSPPPLTIPYIRHHDSETPDDQDAAASEPEPPSPVPTEIIDDPSAPKEEIDVVAVAKAAGAKVRDFAYEDCALPRVPEVWHNPQNALAQHDAYVRTPAVRADGHRLSGKSLHRLLAIGWVTRKEAEGHWRDADWEDLRAYTDRPQGAHPFLVSARHRKPTAAYRKALRVKFYGDAQDLIAEELIYVPPDEPGMDDGADGEYAAVLPGARAADARTGDDAHLDKRRRVVDSAPRPPVFTRAGPSAAQPGIASRLPLSLFASRGGSTAPPAPAAFTPMCRVPSGRASRADIGQEGGTPPPSASPATPPSSRQTSQTDVGAAPAPVEPPPPPRTRTLGRSQTLLRVQ